MKTLKFYNVATKKKFATAKYTLKTIKGRNFAVAHNKGTACYRIVAKPKK